MSVFERIQVHVPLPRLRELLPLLLRRGLNPEIYLADAPPAEAHPDREELAAALAAGGLRATVHGPFANLRPGSADPALRERTLATMRGALRAVEPFAPSAVVFHPDPTLQAAAPGAAGLELTAATLRDLLPLPAGLAATRLLIENIYDAGPEPLADLLRLLPSPPFGFCFDTGHFQIFSRRPLADWVAVLGPWLGEVHLHDNAGAADEHLPPGRGAFDFPSLFRLVGTLPQPVIGTLEMHSDREMAEALAYLESQGML
jgi:sugar phosphate isomerase/epimerase